MPAKLNAKPKNFLPSTLTPLQNKAIKWIAKMRWLINQGLDSRKLVYLSSLEKQGLMVLKARELQPGHVIRTSQGKRYTVTGTRPHTSGNVIAVSADSITRKHTFYYDPNRDIRVEVE